MLHHHRIACPLLVALCLATLIACSAANRVNLERIYQSFVEHRHHQHVEGGPGDQYTYWFHGQRVDHFSATDSRTWAQRYYLNDQWYKPGGPVFLYIGGEGQLSWQEVVNPSYVQNSEAQRHGALVVALEHRFYGKSIPLNMSFESDNLRYLSSRQALEDLVKFREHIIDQRALQQNGTNTWVVFGCSYPGCLSAWARSKYPHLFNASLAGSAPIMAKLDFFEYDQVVRSSAGDQCANAIRNATLTIEKQLEAGDDSIKHRFGCDEIDNDVAFLYSLADMVAFGIQYGYWQPMCGDRFNQIPTDSAPSLYVDTYINFTQWLFNDLLHTTCDSFNMMSESMFSVNSSDPSANQRQWYWQSCNEFGFFQSAPKENSLRSEKITADWHVWLCEQLFELPGITPDIQATNDFYGSTGIHTSQTVFSNGELDPWKMLSITFNNDKAQMQGVDSVIVGQASHCANFHRNDTDKIREARAKVSKIMDCYLNYDSCCANCVADGGVCWLDGTCVPQDRPDNIVLILGYLGVGAFLGAIFGALVAGAGVFLIKHVLDKRRGYHSIS